MCGRKRHSTTRPIRTDHRAGSITDRPADSPADRPAESTPFDDSFGYRVTEEGLRALEEYEKQNGKPAFRKVPLPDTVAEALADQAWRERKRQYRKEAHERGNRLLTVCGRQRGRREVPELRLMGLWLEQAGFDLGRHCEVEVERGTLTIRAI